jgi:hypothetical protein
MWLITPKKSVLRGKLGKREAILMKGAESAPYIPLREGRGVDGRGPTF